MHARYEQNVFLGAARPVIITDKAGKIIFFENDQSEDTFRPTFIVPGKEKGELVREIVERLDKEAEENQIISIKFGDITVKINIQYHTGGDGKAAESCTGIVGN